MSRMLFLLFFSPLFSVFPQPTTEEAGHKDKIRFNQGEILEFDLGYAWFTLGKADLKISDELHNYNDTPCYKVDISGRTTGILGVVSGVDDSWGGYVDTYSGLPMFAYADLNEGKYHRKEEILYDYDRDTVKIDMIKKHTKRPTKYYSIKEEMYDLISGYLKIRNLDYAGMKVGDTIRFDAFYDEVYYDFGLIYDGIEVIKTDVGKLRAHRIIPIIPENKIFPDLTPITAWISADQNQLPLKVEAKMFFGHAFVELTGYKNIKYGPDFRK